MGALTCFCNLYTCAIIKPGKHIAPNLSGSDCFLSHSAPRVPDGETVPVLMEPLVSCRGQREVPWFGACGLVTDQALSSNIWPMWIHMYPSRSSPSTPSVLPWLYKHCTTGNCFSNYPWELNSIKQEQGVPAQEMLPVSCRKQMTLKWRHWTII